MPRPRFAPGAVVRFELRQRSGRPRDGAGYVAVRLAVPVEWAAPLLRDGRVDVDGRTMAPGDAIDLSCAKELVIRLPEAWPPHLACVEMPLDVLHEDGHILVIDKPPGIVVHPARGHLDNRTLANAVRHRYRQDIGRPGVTLGAPHRLDRDTSGVLVFARSTLAYRELVRQFTAREPRKEYWALVDGVPDFERTTVDLALGTDPEHPKRGAVVAEEAGGKSARTDFFVIGALGDGALVRAIPHTGRAHQIRIHLAYLGYPVRGDRDYNPRDDNGLYCCEGRPARQALHASALELRHPATGLWLRFESPWPKDWPECRDLAAGGE